MSLDHTDMVAFDVLAPPGGPTLGLVAHIPHGAVTVPPEERRRLLLTPAQLEHELLVMTDRHISELFALVVELGGVEFVNQTSRLVVDPERFPDDAQEPMARVGMGPVYTRTHNGRPLRSSDPSERARLLASYFEPYARALSHLVGTLLDRFGRCLIIDAHSFASRPLPYEPSQNTHRPAICIGTDPFHTPDVIVQAIEDLCRITGVRTARNHPFAGTYVPLWFWQRDRRVASVMIEVRRDTYMDEATGAPSEIFAVTRGIVAGILRAAIASWSAV
jgi:N-formylglutamate deformylase